MRKAPISNDAPTRWTALVGAGLLARVWLRSKKLGDLDYWRKNAAKIQLAQLRGLLKKASSTEFGREHGFAKIASLPDAEMLGAYRKAVPVRDWYAFKDRIARMREGGEPDVLWPGRVMDFCQTSGTTAGDKFIPLSKEMFRSNYRASLDIFANTHRFGVSVPRLLSGKSLFLGGSSAVTANEHGIRTGDLSGLVVPLIRWPLTACYLPGPKIALMDHWPSKIDAMAEACLDEDVRMISGMCSWALVLFERMVELAKERGRDVNGVRDLWPNLDLFVHGGVKYAPFLPRVNEAVFGDAEVDFPTRLELYPASEGFIAMQDTPDDPGLRLNTDLDVFYEFVPLDEIDSENPRAYTCDRVQPGVRYVVVMTTCAGLYRYIIGDVVEFETIPDPDHSTGAAAASHGGRAGPPRLRIVGRHRHFINAFGENLIVEHIENAVAAAQRETEVTVGEFTAAPVYPHAGGRPGLELAVEFEKPPPDSLDKDTLDRFRDAFDRALKAQNVDYTTKRTSGVGMADPTISPLPVGAFHRWMESKGKLGGQHKCPRCANHREIIDDVLAANGVTA